MSSFITVVYGMSGNKYLRFDRILIYLFCGGCVSSLGVSNTLLPLIKLFYSGMPSCRQGLVPVIAFLPCTACSECFSDEEENI